MARKKAELEAPPPEGVDEHWSALAEQQRQLIALCLGKITDLSERISALQQEQDVRVVRRAVNSIPDEAPGLPTLQDLMREAEESKREMTSGERVAKELSGGVEN